MAVFFPLPYTRQTQAWVKWRVFHHHLHIFPLPYTRYYIYPLGVFSFFSSWVLTLGKRIHEISCCSSPKSLTQHDLNGYFFLFLKCVFFLFFFSSNDLISDYHCGYLRMDTNNGKMVKDYQRGERGPREQKSSKTKT